MATRAQGLVLGGESAANRRMQLAVEHSVVLDESRPGHVNALALAFRHERETAARNGQRVWFATDADIDPHLHIIGLEGHDLAKQQALFPAQSG